jgi:hypothetical protein
LSGVTLPLLPSRAALYVQGSLARQPVEVGLQSAQALSSATEACFKTPRSVKVTVKVPLASGGFESAPQAELEGLVIGDRALAPFRAAVVKAPGPCVVVLGTDQLLPYALHVRPAPFTPSKVEGGRSVVFEPSRSVESYAAWERQAPPSEERWVLELSREPTTDFPLLPIRVTEGRRSWVAAFVVSTMVEHTVVSERDTGVRSGSGQLELEPGLVVPQVTWVRSQQWSSVDASGLLGMDVLGQFELTLDLAAQRLALTRSRP